ncbi:hypothetical protein BGX23_004286 [Mortierella sp. AD031]|nr:hypothetical protein BGX23_004286 [Mortierella sp. AD031]
MIGYNSRTFSSNSVDLRKQATHKSAIKQQLRHQQSIQKKAMPLFPTERTRGAVRLSILRPVDISKIDLMPIEVSQTIIMTCIDEIKLRGLKHKYLFRNAFYSPSVEAALALLKDPKKRHLFSVKAMRVDTVGGLLTTVLSRTYPPLIPPHIQEMFENPNGRFFFELLGLLPELNRYLFIEILDLCCELADRQSENNVSHSKLAIYPGSCCFGLEDYMPTWDTRYLMTPDLKKFSEVFYNIIYAYRGERDLSVEDLQKKLENRDRILAEERLEALEQEHGLEGAQIILRMEARLAQGLPAESPALPVLPTSPSDLKEVSLYAGRKEMVVADDAISVLDIQIDQENATATVTDVESTGMDTSGSENGLDRMDEEEEDVEKVMADLRRSVSVATLGYWSDDNNSSSRFGGSTSSLNTTTVSTASSTSTIWLPRQHSRYTLTKASASSAASAAVQRPRLAHTKSLARFGSIAQNQFPVSPGDIFGISRHAIEQRELQEFLAVARTFKRRKPFGSKNGGSSKRVSQWRLHNKRLRPLSPSRSPSFAPTSLAATTPFFILRRIPNRSTALLQASQAHSVASSSSSSKLSLPVSSTTTTLSPMSRRGRTRQFRKELEVYLSKGLTKEEAVKEREQDERRRKRNEKRAKLAAQALRVREAEKAEAERQAIREQELLKVMTMEETEVLEAFDYLTDAEFEEFMALAGLTHEDVERIREKSAAAALDQVTEDIHASDRVQAAAASSSSTSVSVPEVVVVSTEIESVEIVTKDPMFAPAEVVSTVPPAEVKVDEEFKSEVENREVKVEAIVAAAATAAATTTISSPASLTEQRKRYISPQHMTSMELLIKNTAVIGDSNLRCYPVPPTQSFVVAASAAGAVVTGGLLSQAATVMATIPVDQQVEVEEIEEVEKVTSRELGMSGNRSSVSLLITKGIPHLEQQQNTDDDNEDEEEDYYEAIEYVTATTSTTTVTTTTSGNVQIFELETVVEDVVDAPTNTAIDSDDEELEFLDVDQTPSGWSDEEGKDEEAAELRELLESMTPEERCEFFRLSRQDSTTLSATTFVAA